jgi:GAF domain-containing protein
VSEVIGGGVRAAFYVANPAGTTPHHVVGMPAAYAEAVDGFKIGADSLACGLATHTGRPILTADVATDPRWTPWRSMAEKFDYRGCWSFPIRTGARIGSFAIYSRCPREATAADVDFAERVTQTAAVLIARRLQEKQR